MKTVRQLLAQEIRQGRHLREFRHGLAPFRCGAWNFCHAGAVFGDAGGTPGSALPDPGACFFRHRIMMPESSRVTAGYAYTFQRRAVRLAAVDIGDSR